MADQSKKQPRHLSKSTENTARTGSTSTTTEKSTPFNQKSMRSNQKSTPANHKSTTSNQKLTPANQKSTPANQKSTLSNNNNGKQHIPKSQHKKINTNGSSIEEDIEADKRQHINQNIFYSIVKVNKNKLRVLEKIDFFERLLDTDLEIDIKEDSVVLKGKTQQIVDDARYQIDKQCKEVVTRLLNIDNLRSRFLRKPEVVDYVNFMLLQERIPCSWEVNDKVFDLLVFSSTEDYVVEGSKIIKNCIQTVEVENEQIEFIELQQFLIDNNKVWPVPRKKKGDTIIFMTTDEYVKYQRMCNASSKEDEGAVQVLEVPLPGWKIEYFRKFSKLKLKALCNMYKVDHIIFDDLIELHGKDPAVVKMDIERISNELFISLEHTFGNAPHLTKSIEDKCTQLEKQKNCMISINNKARHHSGWLGNKRDVMMHIITMIGPVETSECDVLICPVTTDLRPLGCVKDIFRIGGKPISKDITKVIKTSEETGTTIEPEEIIVLQNTGNLKCQVLLLTVIPPWTRKRDVTLSLLYNSARKIINIISDTGYRSIGIPLDIADDFPSHMYATVLINNFWKLRKKFGHFVHLYGYADSISTVEDIDEFLISEIIMLGHMSRIVFDKHFHKEEKQISTMTVNIVEGSIIDIDNEVDVVVNATNHKDLDFDVVSRKLVQKAGRETIVNEYLEAYPNGIGICDVAVTQPGSLMCKKIFHGCLFGWIMNGDLSLKMLKLFVSRCMIEAEHRQYTSIAFPAMGSSLLVFPPVLVAKVMFKAVEKFGEMQNPQHLKRVDFVLNPLEKEVIEIFKNVQDWIISRSQQFSTFDMPPKHIRCIHKKHGIRFLVAMSEHYKNIRYKEVKVNIVFVSKENQVAVGDPEWNMEYGSYIVTMKTVRSEKYLVEGLQKVVNLMESHRFHVIDIFLLSSRESAIIKDSQPSSFGPWAEDENPKNTSGMSLQKQIDLIMTTILKNTDKIYEENPGDNYRVDGAKRLSYIRVVRMFTTTVDFKDMMKKHKKGGIEGGHGETSSWHLYEKTPEVYKYHIQAIGRKDEAEIVLNTLREDMTQMEIPKKVVFKILPPVKKVKRKIDQLQKTGYHITLDEAGKKAVLEGTTKEVQDVRKELENFVDNTLNINLSEDDYVAFIHLGKHEPWFTQVESYLYEKGTLVLTLKKGLDPDQMLNNIKSKMQDIRKMSETEIHLQKKMTIFLEEIEKEVDESLKGIFCYLSYNKKRILIKAPNIKKAQEAKYLVQVNIGVAVPVKRKKKNVNKSKEGTETKELELKNGTQFTTKEGIDILVYRADFQKLKVECLVSPANQNLQHSKGIALNVAQAGGSQIEKECEEYLVEKGNLILGTSCSTSAGNLPYHCIIHTVVPVWHSYGEEKKKCLEDLKATIVSALHEANAHQHRYVGFTSVGTGPYGIPKPFCAIQYYKGVEEFGKHMKTSENYIKEVHFIDMDDNMCQTIHKTFEKYLGQGQTI